MADTGDGFLARWSRRKREERPGEDADDRTGAPPEAAGEDAASQAEREREIVESLPDIETMDDSSDFSVFLQDGVPEALKRRALRKLWRLNPVLANLDGLNDYDEDFTDAATVVENLKTLYKVGKGMVPDEEEEPRAPAGDEVAAESPETPETPAPKAEPVQTASAPAPESLSPPESLTESPPEEDKPAPNPAIKGTARNRRWGRT